MSGESCLALDRPRPVTRSPCSTLPGGAILARLHHSHREMKMNSNDPQQSPELRHRASRKQREQPVQRCPNCGMEMPAIAGSKTAVCRNCGYKEGCC